MLQVLLDCYCTTVYSSTGLNIHLRLSRESLRSLMHIYRFDAFLQSVLPACWVAKSGVLCRTVSKVLKYDPPDAFISLALFCGRRFKQWQFNSFFSPASLDTRWIQPPACRCCPWTARHPIMLMQGGTMWSPRTLKRLIDAGNW